MDVEILEGIQLCLDQNVCPATFKTLLLYLPINRTVHPLLVEDLAYTRSVHTGTWLCVMYTVWMHAVHLAH